MIDYLTLSDLVNPERDYANRPTISNGIEVAGEVYSHKSPYKISNNIEGVVYVFTTSFLNLCDVAMSTGCLNSMSEEEYNLFLQFISYQDRGTTPNPAVLQLDKVLTDLSNGIAYSEEMCSTTELTGV